MVSPTYKMDPKLRVAILVLGGVALVALAVLLIHLSSGHSTPRNSTPSPSKSPPPSKSPSPSDSPPPSKSPPPRVEQTPIVMGSHVRQTDLHGRQVQRSAAPLPMANVKALPRNRLAASVENRLKLLPQRLLISSGKSDLTISSRIT